MAGRREIAQRVYVGDLVQVYGLGVKKRTVTALTI